MEGKVVKQLNRKNKKMLFFLSFGYFIAFLLLLMLKAEDIYVVVIAERNSNVKGSDTTKSF